MLTNGEATVLNAYGRDNRWYLRVLYPSRDHFAKTHSFADEHSLTFEVDTIRELKTEAAGRYGLTEPQYEALVLAARRGYFRVPREVTLDEMADELGLSHQALSERIHRGVNILLQSTLFPSATPAEEERQ